MFARRRGHDSLTFISVLSDGPYNADEDVSFLYASASTLYGFAFEAASQLDADYDMPDVLLEIECCPGHWTPYPTLGHDTRCEGCGSIFTIDKAIQVTSNRDEYRSTT